MPADYAQITLRIQIDHPATGVWCAIQEGHGSAGKAWGLIMNPGDSVVWEVPLELRSGKPTGKFAQKDSRGIFIYVLWGTSAGQLGTSITRRAKLYLPSTDFPGEHELWCTEFNGIGADGGPVCATIKELKWRPLNPG